MLSVSLPGTISFTHPQVWSREAVAIQGASSQLAFLTVKVPGSNPVRGMKHIFVQFSRHLVLVDVESYIF